MKRKIRLQRGTPNNLKLEEFEVEVQEETTEIAVEVP